MQEHTTKQRRQGSDLLVDAIANAQEPTAVSARLVEAYLRGDWTAADLKEAVARLSTRDAARLEAGIARHQALRAELADAIESETPPAALERPKALVGTFAQTLGLAAPEVIAGKTADALLGGSLGAAGNGAVYLSSAVLESPALPRVAAHEVTHLAQARLSGETASLDAVESEAALIADRLVRGQPAPAPRQTLSASALAFDDGKGRGKGGGTGPTAEEQAQLEKWALPDGVNFQIRGSVIVMSSDWLFSGGANRNAAQISAPAQFADVLRSLMATGQIHTLTDKQVTYVAQNLSLSGPIPAWQTVVPAQLAASAYDLIGLPPGVEIRWRRSGDGMLLELASDFVDDASMSDVQKFDGGGVVFTLANQELQENIWFSFEAYFGGKLIIGDDAWQALTERLEMTMGRNAGARVIRYRLHSDAMPKIFGKEAWEKYVAERDAAPKDPDATGTSGGGQFAGLDKDQQKKAKEFLALLDERRKARTEVAGEPTDDKPTGGGLTVTPGMVAQWERILTHPQKEAILDRLTSGGSGDAGGPITAATYENAIAAVEMDTAYAEMGISRKARSDPDHKPILDEPVEGKILNRSGLLHAGEEAHFVFETKRKADALRVSWVRVRWTVTERSAPGKVLGDERTSHNELDPPEAFEFEFQKPGIYTVHAFVYHNYYNPAYFTIPVEVKTEAARMGELNTQAFGGMGAYTETEHDFETSLSNELVGSDKYDEGKKFVGSLPADFKRRSFDERIEWLKTERKRIEDLITRYGKSNDYSRRDVAEYARNYLAELDKTLGQLRADNTAGATFFDCRGAYLSRKGGLPDKALKLTASARRVDGEVEVKLYDTTQLYEAVNYTFSATEETFDKALEEAFLDMCKSYPPGRLSLLAERLNHDGTAATTATQSLGFELDSGTAWKDVKSVVFSPVAQAVVNILGTVVMIFAPVTAPLLMPALIAYNATTTIDDLAKLADQGNLTWSKVAKGVALIGLDLLPYVGRAKAVMKSGGRTYYVLNGLEIGGQVVLMTDMAIGQIDTIRNGDVKVIAELDAKVQQLKKDNPSHPDLARLEKELATKVKQAQDRSTEVFTSVAAQGGLMMLPGVAFNKLNQAQMNKSISAATDAGHFVHQKGVKPHYDPTTGRIVGDADTISRLEFESLTKARETDLAGKQRHMAELLGDKDVVIRRGGDETTVIRENGQTIVEVPKDKTLDKALDDVWNQTRQGADMPAKRPDAQNQLKAPTFDGATVAGKTNVVVGRRLDSQAHGHDIMRRLAAGDVEALREIGVSGVPKDFDSRVTEWGLGELPDGSFILIRGEAGAVDWGKVPGVVARAHSHPMHVGKHLRDAPRDGLPIDQLVKGDGPNGERNRVSVLPSAGDISFMARNGINRHVVHTGYVHTGGGKVSSPSGRTEHPTVDFEIIRPQQVGHMMEQPVYRAELIARSSDGKELWRGEIYAMDVPSIGSIIGPEKPPFTPLTAPRSGHGTTKATPSGFTGDEAVVAGQLSGIRNHLTDTDFHQRSASNAPGEKIRLHNDKELTEVKKTAALEPARTDGSPPVKEIEVLDEGGNVVGRLKGSPDALQIPTDPATKVRIVYDDGTSVVWVSGTNPPTGMRFKLREGQVRKNGFFGGHTRDAWDKTHATYGDRINETHTDRLRFELEGTTEQLDISIITYEIGGKPVKHPKTIVEGSGDAKLVALEQAIIEKATPVLKDPANVNANTVNVDVPVTVKRPVTREVSDGNGGTTTVTEMTDVTTILKVQVARTADGSNGGLGQITSWWLSKNNASNPDLAPPPPRTDTGD